MARFEVNNVVREPDVRGVISLIGRAMITVGLILLLFVAYQLWGTSVFEARNQRSLKSDFAQKLENVQKGNVPIGEDDPTITNPDGTPVGEPDVPVQTVPLTENPVKGEPIAVIKIEKIGVEHAVVEGTDKRSLQKGPGHYPATPLPGQFGNSSIAGHRTTYGSPFARLDELTVGDKIVLETVRGNFTYELTQTPFIVKPGNVSVVAPTPDPADPTGNTLLAELTLTTCHPKYSAAQRLIVRAKLVSGDASVPTQLIDENGEIPTEIDIGDDDTLNSDNIGHSNILVAMMTASVHPPLLWWLLLLVTVGGIWWYCYRRYNRWKAWFIGVIPFGFALLLYFFNLEQALPSNI